MTTICRVDDRVRTNVDTARKWALPLEPTHFSTTSCRPPDVRAGRRYKGVAVSRFSAPARSDPSSGLGHFPVRSDPRFEH
jgi:hypothetical protein